MGVGGGGGGGGGEVILKGHAANRKPFYRPSNCRDDRCFPSNGASAYGRVLSISSQYAYAEVTD